MVERESRETNGTECGGSQTRKEVRQIRADREQATTQSERASRIGVGMECDGRVRMCARRESHALNCALTRVCRSWDRSLTPSMVVARLPAPR